MILNGGNFTETLTRKFESTPLHEFWFDVSTPIPIPKLTESGTTTQSTENDVIYKVVTDGTFINDHELGVISYSRGKSETITITSSNTEIAEIINGGSYLSGLSEGSITLTYSSPTRTVKQNLVIGVTTQIESKTFYSWQSDSLAYHISDSIDTLLSSHNPTTGKSIYSVKDHANANYEYNTDCWAHSLSSVLTSNSPWNSNSNSGQKAGALISPRHIMFATHYQISTGSTIRFVKMDGTVVDRVLENKIQLPNYENHYPDITIGLLDYDVDEGISFAKVLPQNIASYLPTLYSGDVSVPRIPAIFIDQEEKALIEDWYKDEYWVPGGKLVSGYFIWLIKSTDSTRVNYYESVIGGDSGSPVYTIINGEAVLLTVTTYNNGFGTSIRHNYAAINTVMEQLGGGYQLTDVDLSSFPTYS